MENRELQTSGIRKRLMITIHNARFRDPTFYSLLSILSRKKNPRQQGAGDEFTGDLNSKATIRSLMRSILEYF